MNSHEMTRQVMVSVKVSWLYLNHSSV